MAGQSVERREVLRVMALAASASQFPGFSQWAFAHDDPQDHTHTKPQKNEAKTENKPYQPQFFLPEEYALVERLAEIIIPSDGTPGARETGVSEFIDFMVASDPNIQPKFRLGLTWLNAHAIRLHSHPFLKLTAEQQNEVLEYLAYQNRYRRGEEEGRAFFKLMRDYTVMGFYTSRIGMEQLDSPALKPYYAELPGCPHPGDPEHKHLSPPKN